MARRFTTRWLPLREAHRFVAAHHRHLRPSRGGIVALGLWEGSELVGVGVLGRPSSRVLQEQGVAEIVRLCVRADVSHAASALLGRVRRVGQVLGFERIVTYTLPYEGGVSLRAEGWRADHIAAGGGEWARPSRKRAPAAQPEAKVRWWASTQKQVELMELDL